MYWFKHDANARRDQKIVQVLNVYGAEGYGWYFMLIEMMREISDYRLRITGKYTISGLAQELRTSPERLKEFIDDCINEFNLFSSDGIYIWSESLRKRMKAYSEVIESRRDSAIARWGEPTNEEKRSQRLAEARKKGTHSKQEWEEMKHFFENTCVKCHGATKLNGVVKDHIIPIYKGGSDGIDNLQPLCAKCNASKGPETVDYRLGYCRMFGLEMPAKWLQNSC